jgi:20S proteasome alpha/beta subunit
VLFTGQHSGGNRNDCGSGGITIYHIKTNKEFPMRNLLLLCFSFFAFHLLAQEAITPKLVGTLLLAAKGKDGIILASDSRLNISITGTINSTGKDSSIQVGYLDNFQKIFIVGKYAFAISGQAYSQDESIKTMLSNFTATNPIYTHPASFLESFTWYIKDNYTQFYLSTWASSKIICCGYYNKKSFIAYSFRDSVFIVNNFVITSLTNGYFKNNYSDSLSCQNLKKLAVTVIDSFPIIYQDKKFEIGGKTGVLKIDQNSKFTWLTDSSRLIYFNAFKDYIKAYFSKKIKPTFIRYELKEQLEEIYRKYMTRELSLKH